MAATKGRLTPKTKGKLITPDPPTRAPRTRTTPSTPDFDLPPLPPLRRGVSRGRPLIHDTPLYRLLKARNIRVSELGRAVGIHPTTITNAMNGNTRLGATTRLKIAAWLKARPEKLFPDYYS